MCNIEIFMIKIGLDDVGFNFLLIEVCLEECWVRVEVMVVCFDSLVCYIIFCQLNYVEVVELLCVIVEVIQNEVQEIY